MALWHVSQTSPVVIRTLDDLAQVTENEQEGET
jgi:hypothetical protein